MIISKTSVNDFVNEVLYNTLCVKWYKRSSLAYKINKTTLKIIKTCLDNEFKANINGKYVL